MRSLADLSLCVIYMGLSLADLSLCVHYITVGRSLALRRLDDEDGADSKLG